MARVVLIGNFDPYGGGQNMKNAISGESGGVLLADEWQRRKRKRNWPFQAAHSISHQVNNGAVPPTKAKHLMKKSASFVALGSIVFHIGMGIAQAATNASARGFVNVTVHAGQFALLAKPLNLLTNTLAGVLPNVPAGTQVFKFDSAGQTFVSFTKQADGTWGGVGAGTATLELGEGFFLKNNSRQDLSLFFDGELAQGTLTVQIPAGYSLLGSKVPQAGRLETDLGLRAPPQSKVYLYGNGAYTQYTRRATRWTGIGGEPVVNVAEGFLLLSPTPITWTRQFSIP